MAHGRRRERHAGDRALTAAAAIRANKAQAHLAERRSLVCFRNAASCCGGSDASNSAHETFSDSANLDLDRITVRQTGVFVGAGFAPAAARLHPEDRGSDAGALVFEWRVAGAAANSVKKKGSDP